MQRDLFWIPCRTVVAAVVRCAEADKSSETHADDCFHDSYAG